MGDDAAVSIVVVDVVDQDNSPASAQFLDRLRKTNETLHLCPMESSKLQGSDDPCRLDNEDPTLSVDESIQRIQAGDTTALVVVPAGFDSATQGKTSAQIGYYSLEDPSLPSPILQSIETVVQESNSAGVAEYVGLSLVDVMAGNTHGFFDATETRAAFRERLQANLATRMDAQPPLVVFTTTAPIADSTSLQGFQQAVPGMGTAFVMLTVLGGMLILFNERRQWTLQRIAVSPVSRAQILGGKAGAYVVIGLVQFCTVFLVGVMVGMSFGNAPLALFATMLAFVLCITGLTFALAPHMKSEQQAGGLSRLLALTLAPLGGAWWPLAIVPPFMRAIGHLSPVAWAMDAFQTLIWYDGGFEDILLELGVLTGAAVVFFVLGVRAFKIDE